MRPPKNASEHPPGERIAFNYTWDLQLQFILGLALIVVLVVMLLDAKTELSIVKLFGGILLFVLGFQFIERIRAPRCFVLTSDVLEPHWRSRSLRIPLSELKVDETLTAPTGPGVPFYLVSGSHRVKVLASVRGLERFVEELAARGVAVPKNVAMKHQDPPEIFVV